MFECMKSMQRRLHEAAFHQRYFVGDAIDVGCGDDSLATHAYLWPRLRSVRSWDLPDGDGQTLPGIQTSTFDLVHSSHSLEHMRDPLESLKRWLEVTKVGGHIVAIVPEVELYEHGFWPSKFNGDHKHAFTLDRNPGDALHIWSVPAMLQELPNAKIIKIELLEATYDFTLADQTEDQTANGTAAECGIEFVIRKIA